MQTKRFDLAHWLKNNWLELLLLLILALALAWLATVGTGIWQRVQPEPTPTEAPTPTPAPGSLQTFSGQSALDVVSYLAALGPRVAGSEALSVTAQRIEQELRDAGWQVEVQEFELDGITRRNIVASAGSGDAYLLGAHYDTSPVADLDPDEANRLMPPPGANDGGSGTAVLLELARSLDKDRLAGQVWLAFLDGQYGADGTALAAGVQELTRRASWQPPQAAVLIDLLGSAGQQFFIDSAVEPALSQQLWALAEQLGYAGWFVPEPGEVTSLGQAALASQGTPVAVIAGSDSPVWRTLQDTPDQIDPRGLERVGSVLKVFLESRSVSQ